MTTREVEHEITVHAPAADVYKLIAEVENWPRMFPPTVHVDQVEQTGQEERIRIWATANGEAKDWTSRRRLDPDRLRVEFRQEVSRPPVAAMGGTWVVEPTSGTRSRVRLLHDYRAVDDDPDDLEWIDKAVDRNSHSELSALKTHAELVGGATDPLLTFDDTVRINGAAADVYDFINEARLWPERLPHVANVTPTEDTPGLQLLTMETQAKDGSVHTTTSVRVCRPHDRIIYKQTHVPPLMTLHTGEWLLDGDADGVDVTSRHTVMINESAVAGVLGDGASVDDAKRYVRDALSTNSLTTLRHAGEYAELTHGRTS
jgi:aromatase